MTLAIGQHKDNSSGLRKMLHSKTSAVGKSGTEVTCLASEIETLYNTPKLELNDGTCVTCGVKCCLDLAAVRGMRSCRGKAAALCACRGKAGRQMLPGDDDIPALLDSTVDDAAAWSHAYSILRKHCSYGSELMSYSSLRDAAHCPPPDYNFSTPWSCSHCEKAVFTSWADYNAQKAALEELKEQADSGDELAEKLYNKT
eukprot:4750845-Pleurochrysis_carterae.AAC.1